MKPYFQKETHLLLHSTNQQFYADKDDKGQQNFRLKKQYISQYSYGHALNCYKLQQLLYNLPHQMKSH